MNRLVMMGGELCINATIAAASLLHTGSTIHTSGLDSLIHVVNQGSMTSISFALPYKRIENVIIFEGIGFICEDNVQNSSIKETREILKTYCDKYSIEAFGMIEYQANTIKPYVYVKNVDSLVAETACGSGSIAASIVTGYKDIIQPTGKIIHVERHSDSNQVTVSAQVQPI